MHHLARPATRVAVACLMALVVLLVGPAGPSHAAPIAAAHDLASAAPVPSAAVADDPATSYGTVTTNVNLEWDTWRPGDWARCSFPAVYKLTPFSQSIEIRNASCSSGWNTNTSGELSMTFMGTMNATENVCDGNVKLTSDSGGDDVGGGIDFPMPANIVVPMGCQVREVCWGWTSTNPWGPSGATRAEGCLAVNLGPIPTIAPPTHVGTCPVNTPLFARSTASAWNGNTAYHGYQIDVGFEAQVLAAQGWRFHYVYGTNPAAFQSSNHSTTAGYSYSGTTQAFARGPISGPPSNSLPLIGIMVYSNTHGPATGTNSIGYTVPGQCQFWFGPKIREDPASERDEPWRPVGDAQPPAPTEPPPMEPDPVGESNGCGFDVLDPTTYLGAGICELVKAISSLIELIGNLLGAVLGVLREAVTAIGGIASAILGGLASIFVPDKNAFQEEIERVTDAANSGNVGEWKDGLSGFSFGSSGGSQRMARGEVSMMGVTSGGGCQGPAISWDKLASVGLDGTMYPLDACSGQRAQIAAMCKLFLTVVISVAGGLKIFEQVGTSLGIVTKQIRPMVGADWSGAVRPRE